MLRFMIPLHFSFAKRKSRFVTLPATPFLRVNGDAFKMVTQINVVCINLRGHPEARAMLEGAQKL
jgi:hypothetical protein